MDDFWRGNYVIVCVSLQVGGFVMLFVRRECNEVRMNPDVVTVGLDKIQGTHCPRPPVPVVRSQLGKIQGVQVNQWSCAHGHRSQWSIPVTITPFLASTPSLL